MILDLPSYSTAKYSVTSWHLGRTSNLPSEMYHEFNVTHHLSTHSIFNKSAVVSVMHPNLGQTKTLVHPSIKKLMLA